MLVNSNDDKYQPGIKPYRLIYTQLKPIMGW